MVRVFISYCRADRAFVDGFVSGLRKAYKYHTIWFDDDISGGQSWWDAILKEIANCDLFIYSLSNDALASPHCQDELREAMRLQKSILPVIIRSGTEIDDNVPDDLRVFLKDTQWEDLSGLEDLTDDLKKFRACASLFGAIDELLRPFILGSQTEPQLIVKVENKIESVSPQWKKLKTGDIYWLGSDLTLAIPISRESEPDVVKHYVRQTFWHASELELGEPIVGRFARLCEKTKSFTQEDWNNPQRRQEITSELEALLHAIAFIMEGGDREFKEKVPDNWSKC